MAGDRRGSTLDDMTQNTGQLTTRPPFRRSRDDRMIAGVCGGAARSLGVDAALLRIALVAAVLLGFGSGLVLYLALWWIVPEE
jgi:phage shock protein C